MFGRGNGKHASRPVDSLLKKLSGKRCLKDKKLRLF